MIVTGFRLSLLALLLLVACKTPLFPPPAHLVIRNEGPSPIPGVQIALQPFKNDQVSLESAIFEFEYLDKKLDPATKAQKVLLPISASSKAITKLPYSGRYRVIVRAASFDRSTFDIFIPEGDLVSIEIALRFNPELLFELRKTY